MPVVISGGGAVATVADTPQIDLGLTNAQLTADVVAGSIDSTQLSSAVNSALTLAGTAVQPAALTSYLSLSGGALTGAVTSTSTITTRQSANTVQFLVSSGTAQTINWNSGGNINLDLSSATGNVTLTLQNPVSGATYRMRVQQGATVRNLTFPAGTVQQGGGGNVYTGIAGVDFLTVYYNGSDYLVQSALNSGFVQPTNNAIFTGVTQAAALRLNGTAVIASTTAPTTRSDGTALVAGDLWYKPTDNGVPGTAGNWIYSGAYWISTQSYWTGFSGGQYLAATINAAIQSAGSILVSPSDIYPMFGLPGQSFIWVEKWASWWFCNSASTWTLDSSNSFEVSAGLITSNALSWATVDNTSLIGTTGQRQVCLAKRVGAAVNWNTIGDLHRPILRVRKLAGTPSTNGNYFISIALDIRMIHP